MDPLNPVRRPCGYLFKNEQNSFIYCCSECGMQFTLSVDLEAHTFIHDVLKDENNAEWGGQERSFNGSEHHLVQTSIYYSKITPTERKSDEPKKSVLATSMDKVEFGGKPCVPPIIKKQASRNDEKEKKEENIISVSNQSSLWPSAQQRLILNNNKCQNGKRSKSKGKTKQPPTTYSCDICSAGIAHRDTLIRHMRRHIENRLQPPCPICKKKVKNYEKHMRMNHLDERPYKCDYCSSAFKQNSHRVIHMRSHTGEKPFICSRCGVTFSSQTALKHHENKRHLKLKPHKCDQCEKSYAMPFMLKDHIIAQHTNEKPYVCKVCGGRFGTRKYLGRHMSKHGEKRFQCKYCDAKFATGTTRRGHERQVHSAV